VSGIIGNGGFRYLFEGHLNGDPYFALTAEAFQATGCKKATDTVQQNLAMFPHSRPPTDIAKRLRFYLKRIKSCPTNLDVEFFDAQDDRKTCLASYIRSHADAYAHLDGNKRERPKERHPVQVAAAPQQQRVGPSLTDLPRWARVAFAARCARQVFPLLARHWPRIPSKYSNAIRLATDLAEQSASEGCAVEGLKDAAMNAVVAAGAALASEDESGPKDAFSGTIASFVAKAAEKAAKSARLDADDSLFAAMEAWDLAAKAAASAGKREIAEKLEEEFSKLHRVADRGRWTDRTKIRSEVWTML
jgi:hypothetical protein